MFTFMKTEDLIREIVKEQSLIIGEQLARQRAIESGVVQFNSAKLEDISVTNSDPNVTITKLVQSYEVLFGRASVEVCMDVIKRVSPENAILSQSL